MPKNREVTVHQANFSSFLQHIFKTIDDHLQYTENDTTTETVWNNFKCNGILDDSLHNVESVAHLLEITDTADMTLGNVVQGLFKSLKVLHHYYAITKVNEKSIKIQRLVINDMKKFFDDLNQDARKKLTAPQSGTKQTVLPAAFGNVSGTTLDLSSEQPPEQPEEKPKKVHGPKSEIEQKPSDEVEAVNQTPETKVQEEGFEAPKKTVKPSVHHQSSASTTTSNRNSFELLQDTDDNEVDDSPTDDNNHEDLDEDISYESSNHPSTVLILSKVMQMAKKLSEDDEEIEIFAKWIESDVAPMMNESAKSVYNQATQKAQALMRENTDKYIRKRLHELLDKVKSTAEQSQVNVMTHINGQSSVILKAHQNSLDDVTQEIAKLKAINEGYRQQYKSDLEKIHQDFQNQTKEYLEDHLLHRRTIFTNQKASFNREFKQMREDMDGYLAKMYAIKANLEDEVENLKQSLKIHRTMTPVDSHPTLTQNVPNDAKSAHPYPKDTYVTVESPYIYIAKAQVHRSRCLEDGTYDYDIFTKTTRYTYHQDFVSLFQELREAEPPQYQHHATKQEHIQSTHKPRTQHAFKSYAFKPDHTSSSNFQSMRNSNTTASYRDPQENQHQFVNNRYGNSKYNANTSTFDDNLCQPCSEDMDTQQTEDDDVVYLRTSRPLMPNQFQIHGQPREHKIDTNSMMRYSKDWNLSWTDSLQDPREFYESLRIRVQSYGILLKQYMQLSKDESITIINENNCRNFKNAYKEMTNAMFALVHEHREAWFGTNPKLDLIWHYDKNQDGFGFLKQILADSHPNLMEITKTETMDKPRLRQFSTWFGFMNAYRKFIDFEKLSPANRNYTDEEHASNILKEISEIDIFAAAKQYIEQEMLLLQKKNAIFPEELKLHQIALTVYNLIPKEQRHSLPDFTKIDETVEPTINRVNSVQNPYKPRSALRNRTPRNTPTPPPRRKDALDSGVKFDPSSRKFEDIICSACGQAGHDIHIHGCDQTAMLEKIQAYKRKAKNNFDAKTVIDIFDDYQKQRRNKRVSGKSARNTLRRRLRAAKVEMDATSYEEAKSLYINKFQEIHPDVDLNDPRQDHNMEILPYDILDSENEEEDEEI